MGYVTVVTTTKDGQGCTSTAARIAATLASMKQTVLAIGADMSGTGNLGELLGIRRVGDTGMGSLMGADSISPEMLVQQSIAHEHNSYLRVVHDLRRRPGRFPFQLMAIFGTAGRALPIDHVIIDLGAGFAHPGQPQLRTAAEAISMYAHRVFLVQPDWPSRLVPSIDLIRDAQFPKAEFILFQTDDNQVRKETNSIIDSATPSIRHDIYLPWTPKAAQSAEKNQNPIIDQALIRSLQLIENANANKAQEAAAAGAR